MKEAENCERLAADEIKAMDVFKFCNESKTVDSYDVIARALYAGYSLGFKDASVQYEEILKKLDDPGDLNIE